MVGLAEDYCVGCSAVNAVEEGFEVVVLQDATRPVGIPEGSVQKMHESFEEHGITMIEKSQEFLDANNHVGVLPATALATPVAHPIAPPEDESSALEEDMYHLTMGDAIFEAGYHEKPATFNYFFRTPPYGATRKDFR